MARGVDDVDVAVLPLAKRRRGLDGDALLPLQLHRVHLGADAVLTAHLVDLVDAARVEEDALGQGGLAAVDVRGDSNVSREGAIVGGGVGGRAEGCRAVLPRGSRRWRRSP